VSGAGQARGTAAGFFRVKSTDCNTFYQREEPAQAAVCAGVVLPVPSPVPQLRPGAAPSRRRDTGLEEQGGGSESHAL